MKKLVLFLILATASFISYSQVGTLDMGFSSDGKVTTAVGSGFEEATAMAIQSDGKLVVVGYSLNGGNYDFSIVRYLANGTLDNTFDGDGKVITPVGAGSANDQARAVVIQSDGKIVVAGFTQTGSFNDFAIVRYLTNGTPDATFDGDGIVITPIGIQNDVANALALQTDGKIVVAGYSYSGSDNDFIVVRYNTNGSPDNSFDMDGIVVTPVGSSDDYANAIAIQTDGKIVVAGYSFNGSNNDFALARYNTNGSLDNAFDTDGKVMTPIGTSTDQAYSVLLQPDGKIIAAGHSDGATSNDFSLARYNTNGSPDNSFDTDGKVMTDFGSDDKAYSVTLQSDGKLIAAGVTLNGVSFTNDFALARYTTTGGLDGVFDLDGKTTTNFSGTSDDYAYSVKLYGLRVYAAGSSDGDFAVSAYINDALALPVSLLNFAASRQAGTVYLSWQAILQENTSYYETERSTDGRNFIKIGVVLSGRTTSASYSFNDPNPMIGTNFYRLKIFNTDGSFSYSKVVAIKMDDAIKGLQLFPNPVNNILYVQASGNEMTTVQILDVVGRVVRQSKVQLNGSTGFNIDVQELSKGKYYLVVQYKLNREVKEFVKQ